MTINLRVPASMELHPKITVFGVGGAGGNAVTNMIKSQLEGVDFVVANTDAQALSNNKAERKIQMGSHITQGLGAGARPEVGHAAAEESLDEIVENLSGSHMVFITAGMGGGTGTGAAPAIAKAARDQGILTVGVVTKPFQFEGARRMRIAEQGIDELQSHVDTLIIIPNQNLFRIANEKTTFAEAFALADEVLHCGVRGITDLMVMPGLINLDFADVRTVMSEMGKAMMGTGEAQGDKRAIEAAEAAISNPLLDEVSMKGARGVLINITGGMDMTLFEVDEAANRIRSEVDPDANIIVGSTFSESLDGTIRVSVVATGIEAEEEAARLSGIGIETTTSQSIRQSTDVQSPFPVKPQARVETAPPQHAPNPTQVPRGQVDSVPQGRATESAQTEGEVNALIERARVFALSGQQDAHAPAQDAPPVPAAQQVQAPAAPSVDYGRAATAEAPVQQPAVPQRAQRRGMPGLLDMVASSGRFITSGKAADQSSHAAPDIPPPSQPVQEPKPSPRPDMQGQQGAQEDQLEIPAFLRRPA